MSQKRARSPPSSWNLPSSSSGAAQHQRSQIYRSSPIHDRSSIFVGHFSPSLSARTLQSQSDFESASHRIAAWKKPSKQRSIAPSAGKALFEVGHDDDGEKWGGKRIAKVLEEEHIEGSCVVARWYGGVLLGPVRFTWIERCAREAITSWKRHGPDDNPTSVDSASPTLREDEENHPAKKNKLDSCQHEEETARQLRQELQQRDESITALRQLLEQKSRAAVEQSVASKIEETANAKRTTPAKQMDYSKMSLEVLRRLDKARDNTISLLLRKIDEAEKPESNLDNKTGDS
ncbi:MAG: hypothetical protein M1831_004184 [Alyxoria varia]|nr:MAG: hypothetical protein M1831_004184 [Alyxoria varia]